MAISLGIYPIFRHTQLNYPFFWVKCVMLQKAFSKATDVGSSQPSPPPPVSSWRLMLVWGFFRCDASRDSEGSLPGSDLAKSRTVSVAVAVGPQVIKFHPNGFHFLPDEVLLQNQPFLRKPWTIWTHVVTSQRRNSFSTGQNRYPIWNAGHGESWISTGGVNKLSCCMLQLAWSLEFCLN